jgi:hypothetical protein
VVKKITIVFLFLSTVLLSADTKVETTASKQEITVGDTVDFYLTIASPDKVSVVLPEKRIYPLKEVKPAADAKKAKDDDSTLELPAYVIEDAILTEKDTTAEAKISVRYFAPGSYDNPSVMIREKNGATVQYKKIAVTVKEVNEKGELADIEEPLNLSGNHTRLILMLVGAALLGALAYAAVKFIQKLRAEKMKTPPIPAIVTFRDEISEIDAELADGSLDADTYSVKISAAWRKLIAAKYSFFALDMTTGEIMQNLKFVRSDDAWLAMVRDLENVILLWDMSKFAEFIPSADILRINCKETAALGERFWAG